MQLNYFQKHKCIAGVICLILLNISCSKTKTIRNGNLLIEFDEQMRSKVTNTAQGAAALMADFSYSEYIHADDANIRNFKLKSFSESKKPTALGSSFVYTLRGIFSETDLTIEKIIEITVPDSIPEMALYKVMYVNKGANAIEVAKWVNNAYTIESTGDNPEFWSFQASSSSARKDWILPVKPGFYQKNYMGMNNSDYGGGIPLVDIWRKKGGIAIGHTELVPRLVSFPVSLKKDEKEASLQVELEYHHPYELKPADTLKTYNTIVTVHEGDYFTSLQKYSLVMQKLGIQFAPAEDEAFEAVWCSWGYMRRFTMDEVMGTLPKVKELGIKWVDIDDGYQKAEGDWDVADQRFPGGSRAMKNLTEKIHSYGMKAKLWWAPLAADPCSDLLKNDPDLLLQNEEGAPQYITWWNSYFMSPAYKGTSDHTMKVVKMFLADWGFDGLKMDGQHLNCVAPDFNPTHKLAYPEQACELLPEFFRMIYDSAKALKPHAVIQNCPCGDAVSFYNIPYMNQAVASDPESSRQTRQKGKTYKAIHPNLAYYGDHVERIEGGDDFASQIGIGAVLGTKFTWPKDNPYATDGSFVLTSEKEQALKHWLNIYNSKKLSKANYIGDLYDIGYDIPETHVIRKGDTLFYAFYNKDWNGKIELRGLKNKRYIVKDYANNRSLGTINQPTLDVRFKRSLLLEVYPAED